MLMAYQDQANKLFFIWKESPIKGLESFEDKDSLKGKGNPIRDLMFIEISFKKAKNIIVQLVSI